MSYKLPDQPAGSGLGGQRWHALLEPEQLVRIFPKDLSSFFFGEACIIEHLHAEFVQ